MNHKLIFASCFHTFLFFFASCLDLAARNNAILADTTAPVVQSSLLPLVLTNSPTSCKLPATTLPFPVFTDDQTPFSTLIKAFKVTHPTTNQVILKGNASDSTFSLSLLVLGKYNLIYSATDEAGNVGTATQSLEIKDTIAPKAVCANYTPKLGIYGTATVAATLFDGGSKDNCGIDLNSMEASRDSGLTFHKQLIFGCKDHVLTVLLRVKDTAGNTATCMTSICIDNANQTLLYTSPDTTVFCGDDAKAKAWLDSHIPTLKTKNDLPSFNNPGFYASCDPAAKLHFTDKSTINACGVGTYVRSYSVSYSTTVEQKYTSSLNASAYRVTFPADTVLTCAVSESANTGNPIVTNLNNDPNNPILVTCANTAVTYKDSVVQQSAKSYQILRTWQVLNTCKVPTGTWNKNVVKGTGEVRKLKKPDGTCGDIVPRTFTYIDPKLFSKLSIDTAWSNKFRPLVEDNSCYKFDKDFYMEYLQTITISDTLAPNWVTINNPTILKVNETTVTLMVNQPVAQDCCPDLKYSVQVVKEANNQPLDSVQIGKPKLIQQADFGNYIFTYTVTDRVGNSTTTSQTILVGEQEKPTAICRNIPSFYVWPSTGLANILATQLDSASYDNYTSKANLKFFVQIINTHKATKLPSFQNVYINCVGKKLLRLWVVDEAGNTDYCDTEVEITNPWEGAPGEPLIVSPCPPYGENYINVAGTLKTEEGKAINSVSMYRTDTIPIKGGYQQIYNGFFANEGIPKGTDFLYNPKKENETAQGLTTEDLVLLHKHILNLKPLKSPYKLLAADVNNSKTITAADLVALQKIILGLQPTRWRFVDKAFVFPNPQNPWATVFPETIRFLQLQQDTQAHFIGFKIGDINGDATSFFAPSKSATKITLTTENQIVAENKTTLISFFNKSNTSIEGFQGTLEYDADALEFVGLEGENVQFHLIENGKIALSCYAVAQGDKALFRLTVKGKKNVSLANRLKITSSKMKAQAYTKEGEVVELE
ncbi:MAG: hypothetical protein RLZZ292_2013 [Bacteroidota bacterium]|jgi:hypothetical protein